MDRNAVPFAVCRLLGFTRMSDEMAPGLELVVEELIRDRRLVARGDTLIEAEDHQQSA